MKYGIVDIGSNTVRLNLYSIDENNKIVSLLDKKSVAGLSSYINDGHMTKKGADKLARILKKFLEICDYFEIDKVDMFATAALRNAKNSDEVIDYVESEIKHKINLVSGKEEACLGYVGIQEDYKVDSGYIVDIGGGSIEITLVENGEITYSTSLAEGHLSMFRKYCDKVFPSKSEANEIKKSVKNLLKENKVPKLKEEVPIYGMGGTIRACGNISMEVFDLPSNKLLYEKTLKNLTKELISQDPTTLKIALQVVPERIHTITPGAIILREIVKYTNAPLINISRRGAREGYLIRSLNGNNGK